jgi:FkbM family methyltransferase
MKPNLICHEGWWWPADDEAARPVITRDCDPAIRALVRHVDDRRAIVQAGANIGLYPVALSERFNMVVTAEPDPVNWACLSRNLEARDGLRRVAAHNAAFGAAASQCTPTEVHPNNCGAHRVAFGTGDVPVITIDSLGLEACGCIWLDVEGSELFALQGAVETISLFGPIICCEDKGLDHEFFGIERGSLQKFLAERGYREIDRIGRDKVFRREM